MNTRSRTICNSKEPKNIPCPSANAKSEQTIVKALYAGRSQSFAPSRQQPIARAMLATSHRLRHTGNIPSTAP